MSPCRFFSLVLVLVASVLGCHPIVPTNGAGETPTIEDSATDPEHLDAKATTAAIDAAQLFAVSGASTSAMDELGDLLAGGGAGVSCPDIELGNPGLPLDITFDYGSGCTIPAPSEIRLSGTLTGSLFGGNSYSLATENLTHRDKTITGSITGGRSASDLVTTYQFTVSLATDAWPAVSGSGALEFDANANTMRIVQGDLAIRSADDETFAIELENVRLGLGYDGRISPMGGSATVRVVETQANGNPYITDVDFDAGPEN